MIYGLKHVRKCRNLFTEFYQKMPKLFFIIGLRRSGTSILRTLMLRHPDIGGIEFEPHDLWNAIELKHFPRLMESVYTREWVSTVSYTHLTLPTILLV